MFFKGFSTVEQIKTEYKRLARLHHPDLGGDLETMKDLNNQYEAALKKCNGQKSSGSDGKEHIYKYSDDVEKEIMDFIYKFLALDSGLSADLIGVWVWITGSETKRYKEELKALGCRWNPSRGCWYFRPDSCEGYSRGGSLEQLAAKYGCVNVQNFKDNNRKNKRGKQQLTA
jgi:hypothetical protein